jgi:rRNA maturation endonuclease Nob1
MEDTIVCYYCGATVDVNENSVCPYCGSTLDK